MRLLILDRDGVINEDSDDFIKSPEEWTPIPGALGAISRANQLGFHVVVVSNQSGLARERLSIEDLHKIHNKMLNEVTKHGGNINAIFFCPHHPDEACDCRKPNTGLFESMSRRLHIDLGNAFFVGDQIGDIRAAQKIGALPLLVKTGKGLSTLDALETTDGIQVCRDLSHAVDWLRTNVGSV